MVDLHSEDAVINHYADRYRNLMPLNLRKVSRQKSSDNVWDETLPLVTTEVVSRDNALGALVGLAVGDAVAGRDDPEVRGRAPGPVDALDDKFGQLPQIGVPRHQRAPGVGDADQGTAGQLVVGVPH